MLEFLKKSWQLILGCLAVAVVVIGLSEEIMLPSKNLNLVTPTVCTKVNSGMVTVDKQHRRLIFANQAGEVVRILNTGHLELPFDKVYGVHADGEHIYVTATVTVDKGIVIAKEVLAKYNGDGKYLGNLHQVEYTEADGVVQPKFQFDGKSYRYAGRQQDVKDIPTQLPLSKQLLIKLYAFWGAVAVLCLLVLELMVHFLIGLRKKPQAMRKLGLVVAAVVLAGLISGFYSNYVYKGILRHYISMARAESQIAHSVLVDHHAELYKLLQTKDIVDILKDANSSQAMRRYAKSLVAIVSSNGADEAFSGALLVQGKDGNVRIFADTALDEPDGVVYTKDKYNEVKDKPNVFVAEGEDANGRYLTGYRKLCRQDGSCFGAVCVDINMEKVHSAQKFMAMEAFIGLLGIIIALYLAGKGVSRAFTELKTVWQQKKEGKTVIGAELIGTCAFFGGLFLCMDDVLWVFGVKEICTGSSWNYLQIVGTMMTTTAACSFFSTSLFPKVHARFSDRVLVIVGLTGLLFSFGLSFTAFYLHIPLLYAVSFSVYYIFGAGLYKHFLLLMSLQFKDEERRTEAVNKYYSSYAMASAAGVLLGSLIQHSFGFTALYACNIALVLLVGPVVIYAVSTASAVQQEVSVFNYSTMIQIFGRTKRGLGFLFSKTLPHVIVCSLGMTVFNALLAKSGVDSQLVTYFVIYGLILSTIFPTGKIAETFGASITDTIYKCVLSFALLLVLGNKSIGWLAILLIITLIMLPKNLVDNTMLKMADEEGYNKKVVSDSILFIEKMFLVFFGWLFGQLLRYDAAVVCGVAGGAIVVMLAVGFWFNWQGRKVQGVDKNV